MGSNSAPASLADWCEHVRLRFEQADLYFGHGTDSALDEAMWLVSHATSCPLDDDQDFSVSVPADQGKLIADLCDQRIKSRRPLAYLINEAWFAGLSFYVDDRVIVPRSHLGEWIESAFQPWLGNRPINRIIDIGTGSGCIAVSLALAFPDAKVDAVDSESAALEVAAINVARYALESRVELIQSDLFPKQRKNNQPYDLIVSNPPYVAEDTYRDMPSEYGFEPRVAFVAEDAGTGIIRRILTMAKTRLSDNGAIFIEAGTARPALDQTFATVPPTWLSSSIGEDVIMMLEKSQLDEIV
jgi:ribosomal protein L3 glutamine methyltransferase